jgi:Putative ABC-transporter type IV
MWTSLIVIFLVFTLLGAVAEHLSYYFSSGPPKVLANAVVTGFPLYGIGAVLVWWLHKYVVQAPLMMQFLLYGTVLSALELGAGVIVGAGPNSYDKHGGIISWDYSHNFGNLLGIIDVYHFFVFGVLGVATAYAADWIDDKVNQCN